MSTVIDEPLSPAAPPSPPDRSSRSGLAWALAIAASLLALVLSVLGLVLPTNSGTPAATPAGGGAAAPVGEPQTFEISLGSMTVTPNKLEVEANRPVILKVTNNDPNMAHDLQLNGTVGTKMLNPGESEEVNIGVVGNGQQAWCTVPGHKEAGMIMSFVVKAAAGAAAPAGATSGTTAAAAPAAGSEFATLDPAAKPSPDWKPYDPALAPAEGATTHDIQMDMHEKVIEVAPGVTQEMWTFGDTVPGPVLRGKVGDVFNVTVTNKGQMTHSIDFHASEVAPNRLMKAIAPGESLVYQFKAEYSGAWMYHCGTAPVLHHIGNGMYGAVIIDPPNLAPVDHEYVFVQSELYFGPQGKPGDLGKMQREEWDAIVFNGYHNQYVHAPIKAEAGKRYRAWVIDDGPSENSSFHIVGTIFDTVFKEGAYLLQPGNDEKGGSQALDLQPAQGGFVEWEFAEDGLYTMVTHKFANVGKGAAGIWQVGDVEIPAAGGGH